MYISETYIFAALFGYLFGSIPFGLILTRLFTKEDIRAIGSGNIGATNVLRTGNKKLAAATLFLDALKGAIPCLLIFSFWYLLFHVADDYWSPRGDFLPVFTGAFAILGHCFPVWLKFKGGKGVATALGVLLAAVPYVGLIACATWLMAAFAFKISSLAALIAIGLAPIVTFLLYGGAPAAVCLLIALLIFWRHRTNIQRLLKGEEPKIGSKNKEKQA